MVGMITARSPYQIYKTENVDGSVSNFNSLPIEDVLPYKIAAAEETLLASLTVVETDAAHKAKYAVAVLRAASAYVSHLISYVPLSARSQTAKRIDIHYDAVVRTVMLFGNNTALFENVKNMVLKSTPANQVSLKDLSDLEGALNTMEKEYRQRAKEAGEKVDMLRKVAPEPPVVVATSSTPVEARSSSDSTFSNAGVNPGEDFSNNGGGAVLPLLSSRSWNVSGKRRSRSLSVGLEVNRDANGVRCSAVKMLKVEDAMDSADGATAPEIVTCEDASSAAAKSSAKPRKAKRAGGLVWGRLRGLTNNEKKAVAVLQTIIQLLGHIFATKFNDLVPLFDLLEERVKTVQAIIDTERAQYEAKEDKKPPEPFHEVSLDALRTALEVSSHIFRSDEECRYELDEDLLHPIAHACLTVINQIEGYATEPFKPPTPEELEKKQQLRDAAREKREEAKRRILEKAEAKAELERKKEEEKQLMRRRLGDNAADEDELKEDTTLANPSALGYVAYPPELPLGSPALYEKALYVWSMLVSVPRALNLSQMYFATFIKGILCEDQDANGLVEEITKCLLDVSMEVVRAGSPTAPRIVTRGKNWFDALVEFVGVASGTKKKRQQQRRREPCTEEEEEEYEDVEEDDDVSSSSDDDSESDSGSFSSGGTSSATNDENKATYNAAEESESKKNVEATTREGGPETKNGTTVAATAEGEASDKPEEAAEEAETDPFTLELKATMENIAELRSRATWGNIDIADRLNLLQFCVQEALGSEAVRNEADRLQKEGEEEMVNTDKKLKEIRDEAEKGLKALLKTLPAVTANGIVGKKRGKKSASASKKQNGKKVSANSEEKEAQDEDEEEGEAEDEDTLKDQQEKAAKDYEAERERIMQAVDCKRAEVYAQLFSRTDGKDDGALVQPLGKDRYHRLYWRFPLERVVFVQTVPNLTAANFPVLPEPEELRQQHATSRAMLLDDEQVELPSQLKGWSTTKLQKVSDIGTVKEEGQEPVAETQKVWGFIPFEYLPTFVQTLDRRGEREALLRRNLETLTPYLARLLEFKEGRVTRSRANMFGYLNRLKVDFSY